MQMKVKSCKKTQKIEIEMSQIFFKYLTGQQLLTFERDRAFANVHATDRGTSAHAAGKSASHNFFAKIRNF